VPANVCRTTSDGLTILENGCAGNRSMMLLCLYILFDVDLNV